MATLLRRWYWALAVFVAAIVWLGLALAMRPLKGASGNYDSYPYGLSTSLENSAVDLLFQLRHRLRPGLRTRGLQEPITIIEIDDDSIKASVVRLQKWRRDWYAQLIQRANQGGASVIGLDVLLSEAGGSSAEDKKYDEELSKAMADGGNVVIGSKLAAGGYAALSPLALFSNAAYGTGFFDLSLDSDNAIRSQILVRATKEEVQYSFSTLIAEGYLASKTPEGGTAPVLTPLNDYTLKLGPRTLPLRTDRNLQVDFRAPVPAFRTISANELLFNPSAKIPDDLFRDRIVLIGATNIDAPDLFATPFFESPLVALFAGRSSAPRRTPGIELHANTIATMLFGDPQVRPGYYSQILLLMLPLAIVAFGVFRMRALWGVLTVFGVAVATLMISAWAFNAHSVILPLASSWLGVAIVTPLGVALRYAHERVLRDDKEAERAQVMDILSRVVSEDVAEELWERRDQIMTGERRVVTIIFTDIRSFTTLSESAPSDQVVIWLNDYFTRMQGIVERRGGHINKFLGDGLMIVFGAPESRGDAEEARAAVSCGLEMLEAVEKMNIEWRGTGRPVVKIGVGIHTGDATCGVVGSERRLEYTIIGDTVNLSSRLESTTKEYNVSLLASDATVRLLDQHYETQPLGEVKVKGKTEATKIFSVKLRTEMVAQSPQAATVSIK